MAEKAGLLGKMLEISVPKNVETPTSPNEVDEGHEDAIVFMRDFENNDLSATQRLEALKELVRLLK